MGFSLRARPGRGKSRVFDVGVAGVVGLLLVLGGGPVAAQGQGLRVSTIATTTKAVYDAWKPSSGVVPSRQVNTFPHGTKLVEVFFEIDGGTVHKTTYQLRVKTPAGIVITGPIGTVAYTNYISTNPLNFQPGAKSGVWTINVLVNGKVLGTHRFTLR